MLVSIRKVLTIFKFRKQSTCNRMELLSFCRIEWRWRSSVFFVSFRLLWHFLYISLMKLSKTFGKTWIRACSWIVKWRCNTFTHSLTITPNGLRRSVPGWEKTKSFVDFPYFMCKSSKSICIVFFSLALHPHDQQTFLFDWMQITRKTEIEFCLAVHATNSIWVVHLIAAKIESFYYLSSTDVYNII